MGHLLPAVSQGFENLDQSSVQTADLRTARLPTAPFPTTPGAIAPNLAQRSALQAQDVSDVTAALRRALEAGTQPPASIIHASTEFARILTGAQGVTLGVRMKGAVVCRARSGDLAPELGSTLNGDSGISGQCLRSGKSVACDDTEIDERVDHDACRALGVRSIVAVPVTRSKEIVGLLEAFSTQPSAFSSDHIEALRALTDVVEAAHACEMRDARRAALAEAIRRAPVVVRAVPPITGPIAGEGTLSRHILGGSGPSRRYWIAAVAGVALSLGALGVWLSWHDPTPDTALDDAPASLSAQKVDAKPAVRHTTFLKPEAGITLHRLRPERAHTKSVLHNAAEISPAPDDSVSRSNLPPEEVGEGFMRSTATDAPQPSAVAIATSGNAPALTAWATTGAAMPTLEVRVSQGVTEARLVHQVQPVYPLQARMQHLSGDVTLKATIAEDGTLRDIGVVHGSPVLAAAAVDAVKQWRYTPSLLGGKPVPVEKQITVVFKLP